MKRINCPDCEARGYKTQMSSVGCAHCAFENTMRAFRWQFNMLDRRLDTFFQREYQFDETRKWRFDYSSDKLLLTMGDKIAVEINGGIWIGGGHSGGQDQIDDMEKLNYAAIQGWKVFHFTPEQCVSGYAALWMAKEIFGIEVQ